MLTRWAREIRCALLHRSVDFKKVEIHRYPDRTVQIYWCRECGVVVAAQDRDEWLESIRAEDVERSKQSHPSLEEGVVRISRKLRDQTKQDWFEEAEELAGLASWGAEIQSERDRLAFQVRRQSLILRGALTLIVCAGLWYLIRSGVS